MVSKNFKSFAFYGMLAVSIILLTSFAFAGIGVRRFDGVLGNFSFNEDISFLYNISLNNSVASLANANANNMTQLNITFPSSFVFLANSTNGSSATVGVSITGNTFIFRNLTEGINATGVFQYFWVNATGLQPGIYNLTVVASNASNIYNNNLTIYINDTTRPIVFAENFTTTVNRANITGSNVRLNVSVLGNTTLIQTVFFNITNITGQQIVVNASNLAGDFYNGSFDTTLFGDGVYNVTVMANKSYGNSSNQNNSARIEIIIDNTAPTVTASCEEDQYSVGDDVTCTCSASDATSGVQSTSSPTPTPDSDETGNHDVTCTATDYSGLSATATTSYNVESGAFSRSSSSSGSSGSGSSGSGSTGGVTWSRTEDKSSTNLQANEGTSSSDAPRVSTSLGARERVSVTVRSTAHHVGVVSLTTTTATIQIASTPQQSTFTVGQTKEFDVTDDGTNDISVTLVSIVNNKANLEVRALPQAVSEPTTPTTPTTPSQTSSSGSMMWWIIGIIVVIVIVIIAFLSMSGKRR